MSISQRLCRICAFPAVDGGVPVDGEKLSEWSRRKLGNEIKQISNVARPIVCQFCIWEARLDHENSLDRSDNECVDDWWTGNENDQNYEKYFYKKSLIQPCRVELKRLSRDVDHTLSMHNKEKDSCKFSSCKAEHEMQLNDCVNIVPDLKNDMIKTCATLSEGAEQMNKHVKQQHKDAIECEFSSMSHTFFLTENDMKKHVNQVHMGIRGEVACIYCRKFFKNKYILSVHINYHHKGISFKCRFRGCKIYFLNQVDSDEHFRKVHNWRESLKKFQCPKCSYKTDLKASLQNHILRKHSAAAATVKCPKCGKVFNLKKYLRVHLKNVHGPRFDCEHCGKTMQKASLNAHLLGFKCKKMLTTYVDNTSYTQNSSNFLENNGHNFQATSQLTSDVPCIYCGKVFRNKRALVMHVKKVHAEIHIKCRLRGCTYYFLSQAESDEHFSKLHQQEKSLKEYQCPKCSYKTCTKTNWKAHFLRRHGVVKKVKCQKCGKDLKNEYSLKEHLRAIHGLRCTCEHCGKTMLKSSLRKHFSKNLCKKVPSTECRQKGI